MTRIPRTNRAAIAAAILLVGLAVPATALATPSASTTSTTHAESGSNDHQGNDNQGNDNQGDENQGNDNQQSDNEGAGNQGNDNQGNDNEGNDNEGEGGGHHYSILDAGFGHGATCPATLNVDRSPAVNVHDIEHVSHATELYHSNFHQGISGWKEISGHWVKEDDALTQEDTCGFDYTALLTSHVVSDFSLEAKFAADGANQGGIVFNQSSTTTRSGASVVDLTNGGSAVRWGHYNNAGYYTYESSQVISTVAAHQQVTLKVVVHGTSATVSLNGQQVGTMTNVNPAGYIGVLTNQSKVKFDSIVLTGLPSA